MTVVPAYGRTYNKKADVEADWNAEKDFLCVGFDSGYVNKPQVPPGTWVQFRYGKNHSKTFAVKA